VIKGLREVIKGGRMRTIGIVVVLLGVSVAAQDNPLKTARDLYGSAAYEEALAELGRITSDNRAPDVDVYRAFCLVALGRTAEAERVAESIFRADPTLTIDRYPDASPRIAALFKGVRKRVLPQLARDEYRAARAQWPGPAPDAEPQLLRVQQILSEAQRIGAWDDTLEDLRVLVQGFLDLSHAARTAAATSPAAAAPAPDARAPRAPAAPAAPFRSGDAGVVPPEIVTQGAPQIPESLLDVSKRLRRGGAIDVLIDERGGVENVTVTQSVNGAYDQLLVSTARQWKYRPATKDGRPVRFIKTVVFDVNAQ
jgi:TonB family protein